MNKDRVKITLYKYQGAGNDFLIADNRGGSVQLSRERIAALCDRRYGVGADGLMLLENSAAYDFRMEYFNSDGTGGMMCGNGGRCMVAFASDMGIGKYDFEAADGFHTAEILSSEGSYKVVRLKMKDVDKATSYETLTGVNVPSDGYFLDTGTRHFVRFVEDVDGYDVVSEGRAIRFGAEELLPTGANVNFVESCVDFLKVRTYEKGVEDETYACGTGIVASCLASAQRGIPPTSVIAGGRWKYDVRARRDSLSVDFIPGEGMLAEDIWLTGPAAFVAEIVVNID